MIRNSKSDKSFNSLPDNKILEKEKMLVTRWLFLYYTIQSFISPDRWALQNIMGKEENAGNPLKDGGN